MRNETEEHLPPTDDDARSRDRIIEAFLDEFPTPRATQILALRKRHPEMSREIIEAAMVANALALHRSADPKDHEVDEQDVATVRRAFATAARRLRGGKRIEGGER